MKKSLENVSKDLTFGNKQKACARIKSLIREYPKNFELREQLAEIYYESGFIDEAGKYWYLTNSKEKKVLESIETYKKSVKNSPFKIITDLQVRVNYEELSPYVREQLHILENECKKKSNYVPTFEPKHNKGKLSYKGEFKETITDKVMKFGCTLVAIFLVTTFLLGAFNMYKIIFG